MTFLNPILAIVGLSCVAIPVLIHILMRRRRRPVEWGAMRFLLEAYRRQRRRLNLEQILLLASRCLLVALLALALGKPLLGGSGTGARGARTLLALVDNSLASGFVTPGGGTALDANKQAALSLISALDPSRGDRAGVIALGAPPEGLVLPPTPDLSAAISAVRDLRATESRAGVRDALARAQQPLAGLRAGENAIVALVSEFRAGSVDTQESLAPVSTGVDGAAVRIVASSPAVIGVSNVTITGVEPLVSTVVPAAGEGGEGVVAVPVRVDLRRSGEGLSQAAVTKVRVEIVGVSGDSATASHGRAERAVRWAPGEETASSVVTIDLQTGREQAESWRDRLLLRASIDQDALPADNTWERPLEVRAKLRVGLVAGGAGVPSRVDEFTPAEWLALALEPAAPAIGVRQRGEVAVTSIDAARDLNDPRGGAGSSPGPLAGLDAVLIASPEQLDAVGWRRVRGAADAGQLIVVFAPPGPSVHTWTDAFQEAMGLEWTIAREAMVVAPESPGARVRGERTLPEGADLLAGVASELPELVKAVGVSKVLKVEGRPGAFETVLALADGTPWLLAAAPGQQAPEGAEPRRAARGLVVFLASAPDLSWTDLPAKPLMVPLVQELVRQGVGRSVGSRTCIAGIAPALGAGAAELSLLRARDGANHESSAEVIPVGTGGAPVSPIRGAGVWSVRGQGGLSQGVLAVNPDPAGGRADTRDQAEIARWLSGACPEVSWLSGGSAGAGDSGGASAAAALEQRRTIPPISTPLLVAAGIIALAEAAMARWFSHAYAEDAAS